VALERLCGGLATALSKYPLQRRRGKGDKMMPATGQFLVVVVGIVFCTCLVEMIGVPLD
jgi:hypothetical protein